MASSNTPRRTAQGNSSDQLRSLGRTSTPPTAAADSRHTPPAEHSTVLGWRPPTSTASTPTPVSAGNTPPGATAPLGVRHTGEGAASDNLARPTVVTGPRPSPLGGTPQAPAAGGHPSPGMASPLGSVPPKQRLGARRVGAVDVSGSLGQLGLDPIAASAASGGAARTTLGAVGRSAGMTARFIGKTAAGATLVSSSLRTRIGEEGEDAEGQVGQAGSKGMRGVGQRAAKHARNHSKRAAGKGPATLGARKRAAAQHGGIASKAKAFSSTPRPAAAARAAQARNLAARAQQAAAAAARAVTQTIARAVAALGTSIGSSGVIILAVVLAVLLALMAAFAIFSPVVTNRSCGINGAALSVDPASIPAGPIAGYNHAQLLVAGQVMLAIKQAGGDVRDQQIAVMAGMGESSLTNPDHGDAVRGDTIGTFQIGPEHGTYEERMNTTWAAQNFFTRLRAVPDYRNLEPTIAAHKAQRNADTYYYRPFWQPAGEVITALGGVQYLSQLGGGTSPTGTYNLGAVKPQAAELANLVGPMFNIETIGGYRESARDPNGHPSGLALDLMVPLTPAGKAQGDALANYLIANGPQLGVDYLIWQQRQYRISRGTWVQMEDRGSPTQNHYDHVHVNVLPDATGTNLVAAGNCQNAAGGALIVGGWAEPATGGYGSPFGMRFHPVYQEWRMHQGIDMTGGGCGAPIRAAHEGTVISAGPRGGYGNMIEIDHGGGVTTRYGHMYDSGVLVRAGDQVQAGQQIATVGSAGTSTTCHLHFEVRTNGEAIDPVTYLAQYGLLLESYR